MTPRTLWTIILKIFGIYLILQIYYPLTQLFSFVPMLSGHHFDNGIQIIAFAFFSISIYLFMIIAFLFKPDWLIDKLKLDQSIKEEKLELNIHRSTVLTIAILLAGILMFVDSLPLLLKELYGYYQYQKMTDFGRFRDYRGASFIIVEVAKLFISIFMIGGSRPIVNFIERKRRGKISTPENPGD